MNDTLWIKGGNCRSGKSTGRPRKKPDVQPIKPPATQAREAAADRGRTMISPEMGSLILLMHNAGLSLEEMVTMFREDASYWAMTQPEVAGSQTRAAKWLGEHRNTHRRQLVRFIERKLRLA
jgi:hypothetical protein